MIVTFFFAYTFWTNYFNKVRPSQILLKELNRAIEKDDVYLARHILSKNEDIGIFRPMLQEILRPGCQKIAELVIGFGSDVNEWFTFEEFEGPRLRTLLHMLCVYYRNDWQTGKKVAEILIQRGANVNAYLDSRTMTPLQFAIVTGQVEYAEFLLDNGARLKGPEWKGNFVIDFVLSAPKDSQVELLRLFFIKRYKELSPINHRFFMGYGGMLGYALRQSNIELMTSLIESGTDVNSMSTCGIFPLSLAAATGNEIMTDFLLSKGANVNAKSTFNQTALHFACGRCEEAVILRLIRAGARISEEDDNGQTPFYYLLVNRQGDSCINAMIQEMAKEKFLNESAVSQTDMDLIRNERPLMEHFQVCTAELDRMSGTKFYSNYSYISVLKMARCNIKKLAKLTRKEEFVSKFEKNLGEFFCYESDLREVLDEACKVRNKSFQVYSTLYSIFKNYFPDIVIRKLAENLNIEDLPLK